MVNVLALPLMYGISKFGCYTAGCCHGIPYDGLFCVIYDNNVTKTDPVFLVQVEECIVFIVIFIVGSSLYTRKRSDRAIGLVMLLCAACKFSLEYLREEHIGVILSMNRVIGIGFAVWSVYLCLGSVKYVMRIL